MTLCEDNCSLPYKINMNIKNLKLLMTVIVGTYTDITDD